VIRLFVGWDEREAVGLHTFVQSVMERTSVPVSITPICGPRLPVADRSQGSNRFTWARFGIPRLCGYVGQAIFMDGADMLCKADLAELEELRDPYAAVQVVKHEYQTKHVRKYRGTSMECPNLHYDRKNWASVMLINNWHHAWRDAGDDLASLQLRFIRDDLIGELPAEWNWLADEQGENTDAKLLHWTAGIPAFPQHADAPHADEWFAVRDRAMRATG
jgi:glutaredoxin